MKTEQLAYLRKVLVYMKMMDSAFTRLNEIWMEDQDNEVDLNDYLVPMYPFNESFDQMQLMVREWVRSYAQPLLDPDGEIEKATDSLGTGTDLFPDPESFHADGGTIEGLFDIDSEDLQLDEMVYEEDYDKLMGAYRNLYNAYQAGLTNKAYTNAIEKMRREHGEAATKERYYVLFVESDVEPELIGPFATATQRDAISIKMKREHGDEHGIFRVYWKGHTHLSVNSYPGIALDPDIKDSDGEPCNFLNHYTCPCGEEWTSRWSCACDDDCPECGTTCEADEYEEI